MEGGLGLGGFRIEDVNGVLELSLLAWWECCGVVLLACCSSRLCADTKDPQGRARRFFFLEQWTTYYVKSLRLQVPQLEKRGGKAIRIAVFNRVWIFNSNYSSQLSTRYSAPLSVEGHQAPFTPAYRGIM